VWITLRLGTAEKPVRGMIRSLARRYGVSVSTSLRVAGCESHFNPRAYDYPYAGVYQQDVRYWGRRAAHFGHRGDSPLDAHANVDVSLKMARSMGWGHWGCA
jgi:soluble lytic murein transglycosylase-like protein